MFQDMSKRPSRAEWTSAPIAASSLSPRSAAKASGLTRFRDRSDPVSTAYFSASATEGSAVCRKSSQSGVASAIVVPPSKASEFALEEEERVNMGHFFSRRIDNSEARRGHSPAD